MKAVRLCSAAMVRRRWLGMVGIALLIAVGSGAVLAAAAGARRSGTAATRLYARGQVADLEMDATSQQEGAAPVSVARLRHLPVVRSATSTLFFALGLRDGRSPFHIGAYTAANADGTWLYDFDRIGLLPTFRGRMPDPSRADEIVPTTNEAAMLHLRLGDVLHAGVAKFNDPNASTPSSYAPITLHVVGIAPTPIGLLQGGNSTETFIFATPAFAHRFADHNVGSNAYVRLRHPGDLLAFEREAAQASAHLTFEIKPASQELTTFARVASPYTNTLWIFALVAAVATMLIVAQALVRMVRTDAAIDPELRALGVTATGRAAISSVRAAVGVIVGLMLAVVIAIAASPIFPLGLVRHVEPEPGVRIDAPVLALGALAMGLGLVAVVVVVARLATRRSPAGARAGRSRTSRLASALARMDAPVSLVSGTWLAFRGGRGNKGASTATSIFGLVAAIAATAAALVFGANLDHLNTPQRYGQTWDAEVVSSGPTTITPAATEQTLRTRRLARGITFGTIGDVKLEGRVVPSYGLVARTGRAMPVATNGRLPRRADEVAFGSRTLGQLGRSVGDTIFASSTDGTRTRLRIVGETLLPSLNVNAPTLGADEGAAFTRGGLAALNPDLRNETDFVLVDLAPHATLHDLRRAFPGDDFIVTGATPPAYIASYGDVTSTPLVLAGLLTVLGIGVLTHLLVTSVRSGRRDLAVLKTLGCTRGQLSVMVLWQALLVVLIALAVGLLIGVGLGRAAWTRFATDLGLVPAVDTPTLALGAIVVVGLVSALVIAWGPARAANRTVPARVLRTE